MRGGERLIREQLAHELLTSRRAATARMPAMWLAKGHVVRAQSYLSDFWGGGEAAEVLKLQHVGLYVELTLRDVHVGYGVPYELLRPAHDLIELLRPRIATPTQWRLRR